MLCENWVLIMKKSCLCLLALAFTLSSTDAMLIVSHKKKPHNRANAKKLGTPCRNLASSGQRSKQTPATPQVNQPAQPAAEDRHDVDISDLASAPADSFASLPAATLAQPQQDYSPFAWASDLWNEDNLSEEQKHRLEMQGLNLSRVHVLRGKEIKNLGDMPFWKYADCVVIGDEVERMCNESCDWHNVTEWSSRVCYEPNSKLRTIGQEKEQTSDSQTGESQDRRTDDIYPFHGQVDIPPSVTDISVEFLLPIDIMFFHNKHDKLNVHNISESFSLEVDCPNVGMFFNEAMLKCLEGKLKANLSTITKRGTYQKYHAVIAADMARACMNIDYSQHVEKYRTWGSAAVLQQKGILPPTIEKVLADHKLALSATYVMRGKSLFVDDISCEILKYPVIYIDSDVEWIGDKCFEGLDNLRVAVIGPNSQLHDIDQTNFPKCRNLKKIIGTSRPWGPAEVLKTEGKLPETIEKVLAEHELELSKTYVIRGSWLEQDSITEEIKSYSTLYIDSTMKHIGKNCFKGLDNLRTIIFGPNSQVDSIGKKAFSSCESLEKVIFVSYPDDYSEWLEEECTNAGIEQDKLEIETCDTITGEEEEEEDASDISKSAVREPESDSQNSNGKAYLLRDLYAAIWCKKHPNFGISTESRPCSADDDIKAIRYKWPHGIHKFMKMNSEQQNSIREFSQMSEDQRRNIIVCLDEQRSQQKENTEYSRWERSIESCLKMTPEDREKKLPEMSTKEQEYINFLERSPGAQKRAQDYFQLSTEFRQHIHAPVLEGWIRAMPKFLQMTPDQQKDIADFSQLPDARMEDIIRFLQMKSELKKSIEDFIQQIDNDEIEQLSRYYGGDYEFYDENKDHLKNNVYVVSGEHITDTDTKQFAPYTLINQKLIFAPNVKSISVSFCRNATDISFMKGSQFTGFVEPNKRIRINVKGVDAFSSPKLKRISLANCNALTVLPTGMFYECRALRFVSIPDTVEEIEKKCFMECDNIQIVAFGLDSRLTTLSDRSGLNQARVCIVPPRFFQKKWFKYSAMFTPWQRVPLPLRDIPQSLYTLTFRVPFEEVCAWSPEYAVQAMQANMLPQEDAQTTK